MKNFAIIMNFKEKQRIYVDSNRKVYHYSN